jgi:hypothetical protein
MLELFAWCIGGFIGLFLRQLKHKVERESAGWTLFLWSVITLLFLVPVSLDWALGYSDPAPVARTLVFYLGAVVGYATYGRSSPERERSRQALP